MPLFCLWIVWVGVEGCKVLGTSKSRLIWIRKTSWICASTRLDRSNPFLWWGTHGSPLLSITFSEPAPQLIAQYIRRSVERIPQVHHSSQKERFKNFSFVTNYSCSTILHQLLVASTERSGHYRCYFAIILVLIIILCILVVIVMLILVVTLVGLAVVILI